ncbi:CPBP family intramembrane glutamic endopeptidase [Undibacterium sp. RuTC16W]|uniref:CPBP family intramembrane glutamic endopeptidase n=1 Tax=Undibacterium sp. RuTC16W TaxID=3413048 RepID=UPI003BF3B577
MSSQHKPVPNLFEVAGIITICFGWFIYSSVAAAGIDVQERSSGGGFSDASFVYLILMELSMAAVALLVLRSRSYPLSTLLPVPSIEGTMMGMVLYFATVLASWMAVMPFSAGHATQPITEIMRQSTPTLPYIFAVALVNGTYEEVFLLGYLVRGFSTYSRSFAIGLSLLVRLLYHIYQGPLGVMSVVGFGLVVSLFYLRTRLLWPTVVAHMLGDILPFL